MNLQKIREGLWRWTAPHPEWRPESGGSAGWEKEVGSVYYEAGDALVLFDPLAPPSETADAERFWEALDRDVERLRRPVAILLGVHYHERSADEIAERYADGVGVQIWGPRGTEARVQRCTVTHPFDPGHKLPGGIRAHPIEGLDGREAVYEIPEHRALVFADAVLGAGNGEVRVAPESWAEKTDEARARYRETFRDSLRGLLPIPVDLLLVSHGEIVTTDAAGALARALKAPAWGE